MGIFVCRLETQIWHRGNRAGRLSAGPAGTDKTKTLSNCFLDVKLDVLLFSDKLMFGLHAYTCFAWLTSNQLEPLHTSVHPPYSPVKVSSAPL